MNIPDFNFVVKYQIQSRSMNHFFTPSNNIINAVKEYNIIRVDAAKRIASKLVSEPLINALRKGNKIIQFDTTPPNCKCCISKTNVNASNGITLIIYVENIPSIFCVHQRFLLEINKYYNIVHFDNEIYKLFKEWVLCIFKSIDCINEKNVEDLSLIHI